ncbi:MAG: MDR family MFS transporter [Bacillota bacterium]|nr:MDR family MFS transporter [Bacillota bacterium]
MTMTNLSKKQVVLIMVGLMFGILLASLDSTIVGTAMPKIIEALKGFDYYTWPVISYLLCITISMPLFGKLADIYGYKKIYVIGVVIFLAGSVLCGMSQNMIQLICFRGVQGIGGAVLISNTMAIIGVLFSPAERAKYMGFMGSAGALASIIGPTLGGYITDNLSWRWIFYVNVPVGIITLVIALFSLPEHEEGEAKKNIDFLGAAALIVSLIPMLLAFTWAGNKYDWSSVQIISMLVFSAIMLVIFGLIERKAEDPIIPLSLFKNSIFNISAIEMFLVNAVMMGASIFLPLFVQAVVGKSASKAGAIMTPMMLSLLVSAAVSGGVISKTQKYKIQSWIGYVITGIGAVMFSFLNESSSNSEIIMDMIVLGIGMGIVIPILSTAAQNAFSEKQMGVVTSGIQFFKLLGSTIASAVFGTVLNSSMKNGLESVKVDNLPTNITVILKNPSTISNPTVIQGIKAKLPKELLPIFGKMMEQIKHVLSNSIHDVFIICVGISVISLVSGFFLREIPLAKASKKI